MSDRTKNAAKCVAFTASILTMWGVNDQAKNRLINFPDALNLSNVGEINCHGISKETVTRCNLILEMGESLRDYFGSFDEAAMFLNSYNNEAPFYGQKPLATIEYEPDLCGLMKLSLLVMTWLTHQTARVN